jgi:hypothetical protein
MEATMKTRRTDENFKGMIEIDPSTETHLIAALQLEGITNPIFRTVRRSSDGETVRIMIVSNANADLAFVTAIKVEAAKMDLTIAFDLGAVSIVSETHGPIHAYYFRETDTYAIAVQNRPCLKGIDADTANLILYSTYTVGM